MPLAYPSRPLTLFKSSDRQWRKFLKLSMEVEVDGVAGLEPVHLISVVISVGCQFFEFNLAFQEP